MTALGWALMFLVLVVMANLVLTFTIIHDLDRLWDKVRGRAAVHETGKDES